MEQAKPPLTPANRKELASDLTEIRRILAGEAQNGANGRWLKTILAASHDLRMVEVQDPDAQLFCLTGATMRACVFMEDQMKDAESETPSNSSLVARARFARACNALRKHIPGPNTAIAIFNDAPERSLADVIDLIDRALAEVEEEG